MAAAAALGRLDGIRHEELLRTGERVTGTVVAVIPATLLDGGAVTVSYVTAGTTRRVALPVNTELEAVAVGAVIELVLDPRDAARAVAPGVGGRASSVGFPVVVGGLTGLTATTLGALGLRRTRRWRRVLDAHPWERASFRYGHTSGIVSRAVLALDVGPDERLVGVRPAPRWALRHLQVRGTGELVIAGPADGEQVVAPPSRLELFAVRPPRSTREAARWRAALGQPEAGPRGPRPRDR